MIRADWCEAAEAALLPAAGSRHDLDLVKADVLKDRCTKLYRLSGATEGWVVLRLEGNLLDELELVIVLGAGAGVRALIPVIQRYAATLNASVRTHVTRPGLERIYEHQGFHLAERVMRWRPTDGQ